MDIIIDNIDVQRILLHRHYLKEKGFSNYRSGRRHFKSSSSSLLNVLGGHYSERSIYSIIRTKGKGVFSVFVLFVTIAFLGMTVNNLISQIRFRIRVHPCFWNELTGLTHLLNDHKYE